MTDKLIEVRCPYCGQRIGLHDSKATEFTCVNCKITQPVTNALVKHKTSTLSEKEFVDIFMHPHNYPKIKVIAVVMALSATSVNQWPKEIQNQYNQYKKRRYSRFIIMCILYLLLFILILLEVYK